jgi:CxxC motif-containing protein (DUF1111 family)
MLRANQTGWRVFAVTVVGVSVVAALMLMMRWRIRVWERSWEEAHDPAMVQAGYELFHHEWTPNDPLSPNGDGLGPVFNATSCVACHNQGGSGGGGARENNVTSFRLTRAQGQQPREGVLHAKATRAEFQETLRDVHSSFPEVGHADLELILRPEAEVGNQIQEEMRKDADNRRFHTKLVRLRLMTQQGLSVSQVNTPALFGSGLIDSIPDRVLVAMEESQRAKWNFPSKSDELPVGRVSRLADGRIGKFGWKGQTATLSDFVEAACANELGLGNPKQAQPKPLGKPNYQATGLDLTQKQCDQITAYVAALDRPVERMPVDIQGSMEAMEGKQLFSKIGCADCHAPRTGDIEGIYSDLLLHRMSEDSAGGAGYRGEPPPDMADASTGPEPREWRTPPLWGVADSAPYMHDGRAKTLEDAIKMHGGQGERAAKRFKELKQVEQNRVLAFLATLRAPVQR